MAKALPIPDVAPETPLGAFAARVIEIRAGEVQELLGAPSHNGGAKRVHDRRVALRRLRTAIEVFSPALPSQAKRVRRELKGSFAALGARRDADVAIEALRALEPDLAVADKPGLRSLLTAFDSEGADGDFDVDAALRAGEGAALLAESAREHGGPPAADALRAAAARRMAEVAGGLGALEDPRDREALHDLRLAAKRLRYVLQSASPALGQPALDGAKAARELQTVLGDLHDYDVLLPRVAAHRRSLRAEDVAAVRARGRLVNATRYRGIQTIETRLRARRAALREHATARRSAIAEQLDRAAAGLELPR
ncbi:MAG: CHAD domain-containing protein [Solirubrobacteraceae bacterium]